MGPVFRACITLALALLSGCASYQPQPVSPAENARALEARTLDDPHLQAFVAASLALAGKPAGAGSWDLDSLSVAALYYHPDLDIARARLAGLRARIISARQLPNPVADLALSYNGTTAVPSPWTVGLMVGFIIETFGKRQYRGAQAEQLAEAARDDLASATWQVRGGVRDAVLALWDARRRLALSRRRLDRQEELTRLIERRFAVGEVPALDVTRERINRNQASLAVQDAGRQRAQSLARLAEALGVPLRALQGARLSLDVFDAPVALPPDLAIGELRARALSERSDIQGLLAEYGAAQSALQLQVAGQSPNLKLGPGYTYDRGDRKYNFAVSGELPVFNRNQGPIAEAQARRAEIAARFTALQARILGAIDAAAVSYRAVSRTFATAEALLADAKRRESSVRRAFDAGQLDRPTLVGAQIELATAEIATLDTAAAHRRAIGSLEDALRTPLFGGKAELPIEERNPRIARENVR